MNNLTVSTPMRELPTNLDIAKQALADATHNWQRVQIRDSAHAVEAAAAILNRRDIQVQAANLVQEAERAIAKATPPQQGKRTDRKNFVIENDEVPPDASIITPQNVRQMRHAHNNLTDAEFEAAQQEAIETQTPLTRSALQKRAKEKRQTESRAKRDTVLAAQAKPLLTGETKYHIIYADPPWRYDFAATENRAIENQYPTMKLDEIKALPVPEITTDDAVLYLWATAPKLPQALEVMNAWGFTYKTNAVWVKDKIGMGYWWRNQHELLLVGTRCSFSPPSEDLRLSSVFFEPRTAHSMKPDAIADAIAGMFLNLSKIELFSRQPREGWAAWGNEITNAEIQDLG
jgi:N6-adenosine-specific RNA methylase IME4